MNKKKLTLLIALSIFITYIVAPFTVVAFGLFDEPKEEKTIVKKVSIKKPQGPEYIEVEKIEEVVEVVPPKSTEEIAKEVILGLWGNGEERKAKLIEAGYNYDEIQQKVYELIPKKTITYTQPAAAINQTETMRYVWDLMRAKGWSENLCAGIIGNMIAESGVRPNAVGDSGRSFGLCQWNGARRRTLETVYGTSVEGQINFLAYELQSYPNILYSNKSYEEIAYDFCIYFERPSNKYNKAEKRKSLAKSVYYTFAI